MMKHIILFQVLIQHFLTLLKFLGNKNTIYKMLHFLIQWNEIV